MGADSRREPAAGYERFFGLHQPPFSLAPDTRFLFQSASHAATFAQVTFALQRREPVIVVTGEIGAGKTLLCRTVVERLEARTFLSIVTDPMLGPEDLLRQVLQDFGIVSRDSARAAGATRHDLVRTLQDFLASLAALDAHAVIVIDEAQHALPEVLEQIRLVSNAHDDRGTMLQLVLAGQTEGLEQLLGRDELSQLKQRVSRYVRLEPLTAGEVARYIGHRLAVARERPSASALPGARDLAREIAAWERSNADLTFTPEAIQAVAQMSRGIPRLVNLLCDRALEAAHERRSRTVDAPLVDAAAGVLALAAPPSETVPSPASSPAISAVTSSMVEDEPAADAAFATRRYALIAGAVALVVAAASFGARAIGGRTTAPVLAPVAESATVSSPAPAAVTPPPDPLPVPSVAPSPVERFEIVVASFHTISRANEIAAAVAALDQPVRQREAGGWQQVLAGPYASAAAARDAQQQLERAGFADTKIVPARIPSPESQIPSSLQF